MILYIHTLLVKMNTYRMDILHTVETPWIIPRKILEILISKIRVLLAKLSNLANIKLLVLRTRNKQIASVKFLSF